MHDMQVSGLFLAVSGPELGWLADLVALKFPFGTSLGAPKELLKSFPKNCHA